MACTGCGAALDPRAEVCAYCDAPTPYGAQLAQQREAGERFQAQQRFAYEQMQQLAALAEVQKAGTRSLLWAIAGFVPCFFWIPNVVAIVLAIRVRGLAKKAKTSMPGTAIAALAVSIAWFGLLALAIVMGQISETERREKVARLDKELASELDAPKIDHDVACRLAEVRLLDGAYDGKTSLNKIDCDLATLVETDDGVELRNAKVTFSTDDPISMRICIKKGKRWTLDKATLMSSTCQGGAVPTASASAGSASASADAEADSTADAPVSTAAAKPSSNPSALPRGR